MHAAERTWFRHQYVLEGRGEQRVWRGEKGAEYVAREERAAWEEGVTSEQSMWRGEEGAVCEKERARAVGSGVGDGCSVGRKQQRTWRYDEVQSLGDFTEGNSVCGRVN